MKIGNLIVEKKYDRAIRTITKSRMIINEILRGIKCLSYKYIIIIIM